jgi:membrane protein required for colicin V production
MAIDITGIILIILFFINGFRKGAILAAFSVIAILLGILCALKFSQSLSTWLLARGYISSGWVQVISYTLLFITVVFIVRFIARLLQKLVEGMMLGTVNRLVGGLLYAFLAAVIWSSLLWIAVRMQIVTPKAIADSKTYPVLSGLAPWMFSEAGKLMPYVKDTFGKLESFFDTINQKIPGNVGAH